MTYLDVGFDQLLSREPIPNSLDPLLFDQNYPDMLGEKIQSTMDGSFVGKGVNADNITTGNLSFDRAKGGTLKLGGDNNINGQFVLSDENNNDRITMDKDGMIIKDQSNRTVIDALGLVSATNFANDHTEYSTDQTNTSGTRTIVTGSAMTFTLARPAKVLFIVTAAGSSVNNNGIAVAINIDGTDRLPALYAKSFLGTFDWSGSTAHLITSLLAGGHTAQLRFDSATGAGGDNATITKWRFSYIILGS